MKINSSVFIILFFLGISLIGQTFAQDPINKLNKDFKQYSNNFPWEKIYLHTDKPHYSLNDTIWFKAYGIMDSDGEFPEKTKSVPLYVDLFRAGEKKPVEQVIVQIFEGKGFGDIIIPRNVEPGVYTLRAYTNWMRNFGEEAFFHKDMWIGDIRETQSGNLTLPSESKVAFFPEGGDLVAGLKSKVAFKALDDGGRGTDMLGYLLDSKGDSLFRFESAHLGMGTFELEPVKGEKYAALVKTAGKDWMKIPLPDVKESGMVFRVIEGEEDNKLVFQVHHNFPEETDLHLLGLSQGNPVFSQAFETKNKSAELILSRDDFNPGIVQFTLFDGKGNPLAERLVYMHQFALGSTNFMTEKNTYRPKEMVRMEIEVLDEFGIPVQGDFSLSVTDGYQVMFQPDASNIHSHFLLGSDLKGDIEMPSYYFNPKNKNAALHLDNLLLTQGWRRFSWDKLAMLDLKPKFQFEEGLSLVGLVRELGGKEIKEPRNITMIINSFFEMPIVVEGETDPKGNFKLSNLDFTDSVWVYAQAFLEKEKKSGEIKQLKYNEIELIDAERPLLPDRAVIGVKKEDDWYGPDDYLVQVGLARNMMEQFLLGREIELAEVTVQAKRQDKIPDTRAVLYGNAPEASVEVTREHYMYINVFQLIRGRFAGVNVEGDVFDFANPPTVLVRGGTISGPSSGNGIRVSAQIWIDGQPSSAAMAITIPLTNIERVDLLKSLARSAMIGGPTVNILTRDGNPNRTFVDDPRFGMGNAVMLSKGYAPYREFYVPPTEYDSGAPIYMDFRSTIYWNPRIETGLDGKAFVEFPLTEGNPEINIVLEGLSDKNQPHFATFSMKVQ
jgi:hypothetical protein